jgi:two-component system copper resistance phosphate regulon response regulator CusR
MRILIAEDEANMASLLEQGLTEENHTVCIAHDGVAAVELARLYEFDAIVLDVMLPRADGFEVARRLRAAHCEVPILMLTARDAIPDITRGLDAGADDYLTKPFAFAVLLARLRAITRRTAPLAPVVLSVADLELNPATQRVTRAGHTIPLTATEYRLLEYMLRRVGRVLTRTAILEAVWGFDDPVEDNTLDAFISLLRNKVDRGFRPRLIHTARGVGYVMEARTTESEIVP